MIDVAVALESTPNNNNIMLTLIMMITIQPLRSVAALTNISKKKFGMPTH